MVSQRLFNRRQKARLDGSAAARAEMGAAGGQGSAARAVVSCADRDIVHVGRAVRGTSPNKGHDPANHGPTQEEIQQEDAHGVRLITANDRWQEIKSK